MNWYSNLYHCITKYVLYDNLCIVMSNKTKCDWWDIKEVFVFTIEFVFIQNNVYGNNQIKSNCEIQIKPLIPYFLENTLTYKSQPALQSIFCYVLPKSLSFPTIKIFIFFMERKLFPENLFSVRNKVL